MQCIIKHAFANGVFPFAVRELPSYADFKFPIIIVTQNRKTLKAFEKTRQKKRALQSNTNSFSKAFQLIHFYNQILSR